MCSAVCTAACYIGLNDVFYSEVGYVALLAVGLKDVGGCRY